MSLLTLHNISTGYDKKQVLFDVSLDIIEGETLLVIGSNGSGKSTLFKAIFGILPLWSGEIHYDNEPLHNAKRSTPNSKLIPKGIMYVPQKNELFEDMTVLDNLKMSLLYLNNTTEAQNRIDAISQQMPELKNKYKQTADRLSGGERKLLSLAMVLANRPKLLLYDEPLAGLSRQNVEKVLEYLQLFKQNGTTIVLIEHRIKELLNFSDRCIGLKLGHLNKQTFKNIEDIKTFLV
jgi:branched-chain amino acid transport system ATP-binding protein